MISELSFMDVDVHGIINFDLFWLIAIAQYGENGIEVNLII